MGTLTRRAGQRLTLAGFSSLLSILQVVSAAFQDKFGISHRRAGVLTGIATAIHQFFCSRPRAV
ncbi:MAG: hypothetical protein U0P48_06480 [Ancrocorticia sp.]